jgi:8-oxo-dGTP diphosphatase
MNKENKIPRIGVGVIVKKDNRVLMGKRKNSHGEGSWQFPGGHLEFRETPEDCARRELLEETGLVTNNFEKGKFTNSIFDKEDKHYITLFITTNWEEGEPEIKEPEKCEGWEWFEWENLPKPLFLPIENLLKEGFNPFV